MLKNKYCCLCICVILTSLCLFGCKKEEKAQQDSKIKTEKTADNKKDVSDRPETDGGGNENNNENDSKTTIINVIISEGKYYYNNEPIELNELIDAINEYNCEIIVHIKDENATKNAYSSLIDELNKLEIAYEVE